MGVTVKVQALDRDVSVLFPDDFSPQARSKFLADTARSELRAGQEKNRAALGRVPPHDTYVDGGKSENLDAVKPDGVIVFEFELLADTFGWVEKLLEEASPVKTGRYQRSHIFLADGQPADPDAPPPAQEYVFVNTQPYARKIEKGQSQKAPEGVYQVVAGMASRRLSNVASVKFGYRSINTGALAKWAAGTGLQRRPHPHKRQADRESWLTRQPAIIVSLK
jgi:hypothetical protein